MGAVSTYSGLYGSDGLVHFMPFTDETHNGQYAKKHIGRD